jgi:acetylornithine/succinyldiaminopimelate/putrescine aminotransferase
MALSLTPNHDYQDIFKPLLPDVVTLPFGRIEAVREAIDGLGSEQTGSGVSGPSGPLLTHCRHWIVV